MSPGPTTTSATTTTGASARRIAHIMVAGATIGLAFKGIFARLAYAEGLSVTGVLVLRILMAAPLFLVGAAALEWGGGAGRAEGRPRREVIADHVKALLTGALFISATLMDFLAIERIGAGPSRVILFIYPGFILLFDALRERAWPPARQLVVFGLAWTGLVMVAAPDGFGAMGARTLTGVGMSLVGAVSYAVFTVVSQTYIARLGSPRFVALNNTGAALLLLGGLATFIDPAAVAPTEAALGWMVAMVLLSTVGPMFLMFEGIGRLGAGRVSLLMLMGPPITVLAAWLVLGERLQPLQVAGTALVVIAMGVLRGAGKKKEEEAA